MTTLDVFNLLGQPVIRLVEEHLPAGPHRVRWDGVDSYGQTVPSGIYLYRIISGEFTATKKMILLK